eukprot:6461464-Prymnesium_polylepis.2
MDVRVTIAARAQELANLERFSKRQQKVPSAEPNLERLLTEEGYLQSRLEFVKQELAELRGPPAASVAGLSI